MNIKSDIIPDSGSLPKLLRNVTLLSKLILVNLCFTYSTTKIVIFAIANKKKIKNKQIIIYINIEGLIETRK